MYIYSVGHEKDGTVVEDLDLEGQMQNLLLLRIETEK